MKHADIQAHVDAIADAIKAKGRDRAHADIEFESHGCPRVHVRYGGDWTSNGTYEFFRGDHLTDAINQAYAWADAIPSIEQERHEQFMRKVGTLLDEARKHGIDTAFVNPLEVLMKSLSENVITHREDGNHDD